MSTVYTVKFKFLFLYFKLLIYSVDRVAGRGVGESVSSFYQCFNGDFADFHLCAAFFITSGEVYTTQKKNRKVTSLP
jgi:hypothetical protein